MRRISHLLVVWMAGLLVAGCAPVVEVRLVTKADLTATALAAVMASPTTGVALPTAVPATPEATAETPSLLTATPNPSATVTATSTQPPATATARPTLRPPTATPTPGVAAARIQFQPGATSAVRSGHLGPDGSDLYVLAASAGQLMDVELSSATPAGLSIWGADGTVLKRAVDDTPNWQGTLPSSQDYYVQVLAAGEAVDYGLRVTVFARIQFAAGATSATVSGPVERLGPEGVEVAGGYVLRAMAGQTMQVRITSPGGDVLLTIVGADGVPLKRYVDGSAEWEGVLPSTQDYYLEPVSVGGPTRFTMTVQINPLP